MTPAFMAGPPPVGWQTAFEASPVLPHCRLMLWHPEVDHQKVEVQVAWRGPRLILQLRRSPDAGPEEVSVELGDGLEVKGLRAERDHLCVALMAAVPWKPPTEGQGISGYDDWELRCRRCREELLRPRAHGEDSMQALLLPSTLWQACAEVVACEECTPMGQGHVVAQPGRLLVEEQGILVAAGLVHCSCGAVLGEGPPAVGIRRRDGLCGAGYGRRCAARGVLLYKHRTCLFGDASSDDLFAAFTEESAVAAHLLSVRQAEGHSRFVLLPSYPSRDGKLEDSPGKPIAEALELRLAVPELFLGGGICGGSTRRVCKVFFRPCSCLTAPLKGPQVVVPQEAYEAVCHVLEDWVQRSPDSLSTVPDHWRSAYLPRPPELCLDEAIRAENLASIYQGSGQLSEAEALVRKALATMEAAFAPEVKDVRPAGIKARLAQILHMQGRFGEDSLGPEHPQTLSCVRNLAVLLKQLPKERHSAVLPEAEAEPLLRGALGLFEDSLGPEHPQTLSCALLRRAVVGYAAAFGKEHPEAQRVQRNLNNFIRWRSAQKADIGVQRLRVKAAHAWQSESEAIPDFLKAMPAPRQRGGAADFIFTRPSARTSFRYIGDTVDEDTGGDKAAPSQAAVDREKEEEEEFGLEEYPKTCRVELMEHVENGGSESRPCEQETVDQCMDLCREQYVRYRHFGKPLPPDERKVCYLACIDHCVIGRAEDGTVRPQCPLVNGYSERYTTWENIFMREDLGIAPGYLVIRMPRRRKQAFNSCGDLLFGVGRPTMVNQLVVDFTSFLVDEVKEMLRFIFIQGVIAEQYLA
ncbi:Nephrocystin-3 [Symbiodinium microadriaticum]|uniref:Nephrocystin-3 n=1 Tax=Symbiodinium microadriaticum TaxID=2951 RepID=A0A1Q9DIR5_SYMMI|nr:Nephrocystin-3 [Symbiodinium microadriaticum]